VSEGVKAPSDKWHKVPLRSRGSSEADSECPLYKKRHAQRKEEKYGEYF